MLPTTGSITTTMVGNEMGVSTRGVSALCTHTNVNKWAKYKPVRLNTSTPDRNSEWWKGDIRNCGFNPVITGTYLDMVSLYNNSRDGLNGWTYSTLTTGDYCRLADFRGYNHQAVPPISNFTVDRKTVTEDGNQTLSFLITMSGGTNNLALGDISDYGNYYFGILLYGTNNKKAIATSAYRLSTDSPPGAGQECSIGLHSLPLGTFEAYPFISMRPIVQNDQELVNQFSTIPGVSPITITKAASIITLDFQSNLVGNICYTTVSVTNRGSSSFSIQNGVVFYRFPSRGYADPIVTGETRLVLMPKTVAAGTTFTYPRVNANVVDILDSSGKVRIWASVNNSSVMAPYLDLQGETPPL